MDIADIVSTEFVAFDADTPLSTIGGVFDDPSVEAIVVMSDEAFCGVVTRRQLVVSPHPPNGAIEPLVQHVPGTAPGEDIREAARLMVDNVSPVLPVFEGRRMVGVVRADDLLREAEPFFDVATVADAYSPDLVTLAPGTTFGEAVRVFREHRIAHLPIVADGSAVGMLRLRDVTDRALRVIQRCQAGEPSSVDDRGGSGRAEGDPERLLELLVRDVMTSPVLTIDPDRTLEVAAEEMRRADGSSLVVVSNGGAPIGIVTKTDLLESLARGAHGDRPVQVYGADLIDDRAYGELVDAVDRLAERAGDVRVLDAKIHLSEHDETARGRPLVLVRVHLSTDRGSFIASGEGYGAGHAIHEACNVLERLISDDRTNGRNRKHPDEEFWANHLEV